eukprot:CAMPEP_0198142306 /NCGR_PEP_ID=MMETSP1443-20131203/5126_1 /TAXON_ID=186043 /ORGANISM="Entomoneis sp., Strain CCMP2396" /LENGTH=44 /DNA_ID= /DNA_START= /DNA_END= /DNA_ORIENTATION=
MPIYVIAQLLPITGDYPAKTEDYYYFKVKLSVKNWIFCSNFDNS